MMLVHRKHSSTLTENDLAEHVGLEFVKTLELEMHTRDEEFQDTLQAFQMEVHHIQDQASLVYQTASAQDQVHASHQHIQMGQVRALGGRANPYCNPHHKAVHPWEAFLLHQQSVSIEYKPQAVILD
jgi:hypothetical protein